MNIVLIPGLWLNAGTWDKVVPLLEKAGHTPVALTLPGMESKDTPRAEVSLEDQVSYVVEKIDELDGPVLLVGHSAGAVIAHIALDRRVDRVAGAVHVGGFPISDGSAILAGLPSEGGDVPMPDWEEIGEEANIADFDEEALAAFYAEAIPAPAAVLGDPVVLSDLERLDVPVVLVCPEYSAEDLQEWIDSGEPELAELAALRNAEMVDLPGGHWPQLTQPEALAEIIVDVAARLA